MAVGLLVAGLLAVAPGCVTIRANVGHPMPSEAAVAAVEPGVSTRADVVALLGPPEEWRAPAVTDDTRLRDGPGLRVREEREIFRRTRYTWSRERRHTDGFWIIPFFGILGYLEEVRREDRIVVTFDERGVVEDVAGWKGIPW